MYNIQFLRKGKLLDVKIEMNFRLFQLSHPLLMPMVDRVCLQGYVTLWNPEMVLESSSTLCFKHSLMMDTSEPTTLDLSVNTTVSQTLSFTEDKTDYQNGAVTYPRSSRSIVRLPLTARITH